ncbi:hypothetical protein ACFQMM_13705 [Saliphagus sp. GCM10025308]
MRYIHDGKLRETTIDPPPVFVFDESQNAARGRTDTAALMVSILAKQRRMENRPLLIDHEESEWRWSK